LAALLFERGRVAWLRGAWQARSFVPLVSRDTASELLRVLRYPKFRLSAGNQEDLLAEYLPWCESVRVNPRLRVPRCRDAQDEMFLRLARAGRADCLVTGDADLLCLRPQFDIPIIDPAGLRRRLKPGE
jgi:putative PIN family toxin of toxin-antitoxin system